MRGFDKRKVAGGQEQNRPDDFAGVTDPAQGDAFAELFDLLGPGDARDVRRVCCTAWQRPQKGENKRLVEPVVYALGSQSACRFNDNLIAHPAL